VSWHVLVFPAMALRMKVTAAGLESLRSLPLPVLFVANHQSIIDVPVILKALPAPLRRRLAPAMGTGRKNWEMLLSALFFHAYPLPGTSAGLREAIQHTGDLADRGYCPLVFPEGVRTPDGRLQPFRPGIGVIAKQTRLPIVPVRIEGAYEIWPIHARGPGKGAVTVTFGPMMRLADHEPSSIVAALEAWYRE
jgi:long-chain acyl-CoA synthetase